MTAGNVPRELIAPVPADVQPVSHELLHRTLTGLVTAVPILALGVAAWRSWEGLLHPRDLIVFGVLYLLTGLGVTAGSTGCSRIAASRPGGWFGRCWRSSAP